VLGTYETMIETIINIPFELDLEGLLKEAHVESGTDDAAGFEELLNRAREVAKPKALYKECFIQLKGEETITIDNITFATRALRMNLDQVERVFPYVATCGKEVDEINIPESDFLSRYWLDIIKAALLRVSCCHLESLLVQKYKLGKTSVMSPGSGDVNVWPIKQQKELFSLFGDVEDLIGVRLTESFLMLPNKSVSGVRFPTEIDFQSCQLCHRENCFSRKAPFNEELWESVRHD